MVECLPSMSKLLGSTVTLKKEREREKRETERERGVKSQNMLRNNGDMSKGHRSHWPNLGQIRTLK